MIPGCLDTFASGAAPASVLALASVPGSGSSWAAGAADSCRRRPESVENGKTADAGTNARHGAVPVTRSGGGRLNRPGNTGDYGCRAPGRQERMKPSAQYSWEARDRAVRSAKVVDVPPRRIGEIDHGRRSITTDSALRIGQAVKHGAGAPGRPARSARLRSRACPGQSRRHRSARCGVAGSPDRATAGIGAVSWRVMP